MTRDHAVFLRDNRNPSMRPLRAALAEAGFTEVGSFGASGNFVFHAPFPDVVLLEQCVEEVLGAEAFVRSRRELSDIVAHDPYSGRPGAGLFLARRPVEGTSAVFRDATGPDGDPPVAYGATVYFVNPTRIEGRKSVVDFERELGVRGTMRTSRVAGRVLDMMDEGRNETPQPSRMGTGVG